MVMFAHSNGTTLTVQGIVWQSLKYNGKIGFKTDHHAVVFNIDKQLHCVMQDGQCRFMGSVSECLEAASGIVFDFYAHRIVPSWESN